MTKYRLLAVCSCSCSCSCPCAGQLSTSEERLVGYHYDVKYTVEVSDSFRIPHSGSAMVALRV